MTLSSLCDKASIQEFWHRFGNTPLSLAIDKHLVSLEFKVD